MPHSATPDDNRLLPAEKFGIGLLVIALVALGVMVEIRSAFLKVRRTDFGVYTRAAWAVQTGENIYEVQDDRGWHYCYPPPFAVMMTPLADPPQGQSRFGYLPFSFSVAVWYLFSVTCVWFAFTQFSRAVLPHEPFGTRRWVTSRTWPFALAGGTIGYTLARGQVNLLVVAILAGMFADRVRGLRFRAGLWLGTAIALKVIPAFLVLYFVFKRDGRAIIGVGVMLLVWLLVVPSAVWGVPEAIALNQQMIEKVLQPGTTGEGDQTRAVELTNATATDSQSFQSLIHNWLHPDATTRPATASRETRLAHWLIGGLLACSLAIGYVRSPNSHANDLVFLGALCVLMLHLSPVSHMHYYTYAIPLVSGLWLKSLADDPTRVIADRVTFVTLALWCACTAAPLFPGSAFDIIRIFGLGQVATVALLFFGCWRMQPQSNGVVKRLGATKGGPFHSRLAA